jgi:hypothetical protein
MEEKIPGEDYMPYAKLLQEFDNGPRRELFTGKPINHKSCETCSFTF